MLSCVACVYQVPTTLVKPIDLGWLDRTSPGPFSTHTATVCVSAARRSLVASIILGLAGTKHKLNKLKSKLATTRLDLTLLIGEAALNGLRPDATLTNLFGSGPKLAKRDAVLLVRVERERTDFAIVPSASL